MAEALLRDRAGDLFEVFSAHTMPRGINPLPLRVLREIGLHTDGLRSKGIDEYVASLPVSYLIVVCARGRPRQSEQMAKCPRQPLLVA